jgi:hypothetical protein
MPERRCQPAARYDASAGRHHTLRIESVDVVGNVAGQERNILIDNNPPTAATDFVADTGQAWRATNSFAFSWRNPPQLYAPIAGAEYELCPAANAQNNHSG